MPGSAQIVQIVHFSQLPRLVCESMAKGITPTHVLLGRAQQAELEARVRCYTMHDCLTDPPSEKTFDGLIVVEVDRADYLKVAAIAASNPA